MAGPGLVVRLRNPLIVVGSIAPGAKISEMCWKICRWLAEQLFRLFQRQMLEGKYDPPIGAMDTRYLR